MPDNVYNIEIPFVICTSVLSCLRSEAFASRYAYRLYVKGYVSALRDIGASEDSVSCLHDAFADAENDLFIDV